MYQISPSYLHRVNFKYFIHRESYQEAFEAWVQKESNFKKYDYIVLYYMNSGKIDPC